MRWQQEVVLVGERVLSGRVVTVAEGRITAVEPASAADASIPDLIHLSGRSA
jgi:hypothetical protein